VKTSNESHQVDSVRLDDEVVSRITSGCTLEAASHLPSDSTASLNDLTNSNVRSPKVVVTINREQLKRTKLAGATSPDVYNELAAVLSDIDAGLDSAVFNTSAAAPTVGACASAPMNTSTSSPACTQATDLVEGWDARFDLLQILNTPPSFRDNLGINESVTVFNTVPRTPPSSHFDDLSPAQGALSNTNPASVNESFPSFACLSKSEQTEERLSECTKHLSPDASLHLECQLTDVAVSNSELLVKMQQNQISAAVRSDESPISVNSQLKSPVYRKRKRANKEIDEFVPKLDEEIDDTDVDKLRALYALSRRQTPHPPSCDEEISMSPPLKLKFKKVPDYERGTMSYEIIRNDS